MVTAACSNPPWTAPGASSSREVLRSDAVIRILLTTGLVAPPPGQRGILVGGLVAVGGFCRLRALGVEHPRVQVAQPSSDAVRRGLGEDQDAERGEHTEHDARADVGDQERQGLAEHPAEDSAGLAQRRQTLPRLRAPSADVAEARDRQDEEREADADAPVVVHGCRVTEEPSREQEQQDGQDECDPADEPARGVGADGLRRSRCR